MKSIMNKDDKGAWALAWKDVNSWTKPIGKNQGKQLLHNSE